MKLGFIDLLKPQFLAGFRLPSWLDDPLSFFAITNLQTAITDEGVSYVGFAQLQSDGGADWSSLPQIQAPSGSVMRWQDINAEFRLTIPRKNGDYLKEVVDDLAGLSVVGSSVADVQTLLNLFEDSSDTSAPSDYPIVGFRLELLVNLVSLHIPKKAFLPARNAADGWLEPDPAYDEVRFELPKIAMILTQGEEIGDFDFELAGWGVQGLDDPMDLAAGELIRMVPSLCLHESKVFGFGMEKAVLDLSSDFTPPELLEQFGVGDEFSGFWIPLVRFFLAPNKTNGFAFDLQARDLLVDVNQGFSGEFALAIMRRNDRLKVVPKLFEGDNQLSITRGNEEIEENRIRVRSRASVAADGELQLAISGGQPPYRIEVSLDGTEIISSNYEGDSRRQRWLLERSMPGEATLQIMVTDRSATPQIWEETISLQLREAGTLIETDTRLEDPTLTDIDGTSGFTLRLAANQPEEEAVYLHAEPANVDTVSVGRILSNGQIRVPVTPGAPAVRLRATWASIAEVSHHFDYDVPDRKADLEAFATDLAEDAELKSAVTRFFAACPLTQARVEASSSYEPNRSGPTYNQELSERRKDVFIWAVEKITSISVAELEGISTAIGFCDAQEAYYKGTNTYRIAEWQYAKLYCDTDDGGTRFREVDLVRPQTREPIRESTPRGPAPTAPERPPIFRRIEARVRFQRNDLVFGELSGQLDFQTQAEDLAQRVNGDLESEGRPADASSSDLSIRSNPEATADASTNPGDGIVDWRLSIFHDTATQRLTQEIELGAGENDKDGLIHFENDSDGVFGNILGAVLTFAPLISGAVDSAVTKDGGEPIAEYVLAAGAFALAGVLGGTGIIKTQRIILFGGEISAQQSLGSTNTFDQLSVLFDYGVHFEVDLTIGPIRIQSTPGTPMKVRYKALGFKLDFQGEYPFRPVFDTSKGYELDLSDPGLFNLGNNLGNLLQVLGARLGVVNPFVLEFDLGLKVNLGIISVDRIRITVPLEPLGPPTIIPTGMSVDIPGTLTGQGYIDMRDGFEGAIDVSLVPVKLRLAASVAIKDLEDDSGRKATGIYLGIEVEFPAAIPIAGTGMGIFGVLGLFAMHYKRLEDESQSVPALHWFREIAKGEPNKIAPSTSAPPAWGPEIDRWSFGLGVVLGTMEGGTLLNLKGMLVLELPGPRILILVNAKILTEKPETKGANESEVGILAVVDLDFNLNRLTIGLIASYEIENLLVVKIPVEASFDFNDLSKWHLYIGTFKAPVTASVLELVKAEGYLMFAGDAIEDFPAVDGPKRLPGVAIALGIRVSIVFGNESIGLYLKVAVSLDVGLSFSPFYIYGVMVLEGKLRLFIITISAYARLIAEVGVEKALYLKGEVCGKVKLFFFTIKGCVSIEFGNKPAVGLPPPLVRAMVLQSRSPALIQRQGTDRGIDTSLGDAFERTEDIDRPEDGYLTVPVDAMPILKLQAPPQVLSSFAADSFVASPGVAANATADGWISQGDGLEYRYQIQSVTIDGPIAQLDPPVQPPSVFRSTQDAPGESVHAVDLALLSWNPETTPRAVQRSEQLTETLTRRWARVCDEPAPPACVLWTFNEQPLGTSDEGWNIKGTPWPDPPGVKRYSPPSNYLRVQQSQQFPGQDLIYKVLESFNYGTLIPAQIIGDDPLRNELVPNAGISGTTEQLDFSEVQELIPGRALALPVVDHQNEDVEEPLEVDLPPEYQDLTPPQEMMCVRMETEAIAELQLLVSISQNALANQGTLWLRGLDDNGNMIEEQRINDFGGIGVPINTINELPTTWLDPVGPWSEKVEIVWNYLQQRVSQHSHYYVKWNPDKIEAIHSVEVFIKLFNPDLIPQVLARYYPPALLSIVECCRLDELRRFNHDQSRRNSEIDRLDTAFNAERLRPLLVPDTLYTVSVNYQAEARQLLDNGEYSENQANLTQQFQFRTDGDPPERLNPWVLGAIPEADDRFHFAGEGIKVFFNDESIIQLFETYGVPLKGVIRKANGDQLEDEPAVDWDAVKRQDALPSGLLIRTPFEDTLRQIGLLEYDCISAIGEEVKPRIFSVCLPVDRNESYNFDIERIDGITPTDGDAQARLFRVSFRTSRFNSVAELADYILSTPYEDVCLETPLSALPVQPTDIAIQDAFINAGIEAMPTPDDPKIYYLWAPGIDGTHVLQAMLLDAPEPIWRTRMEPELERITSDNGYMEHWIKLPKPYLELVEGDDSDVVRQFSYSPSGARTIIYLQDGAEQLDLKLRKYPYYFERISMTADEHEDFTLFNMALPTVPPWILHAI